MFMCTQSTKDLLERVVRSSSSSSDLRGLCLPGAPKTAPLGREEAPSSAGGRPVSATTGCPGLLLHRGTGERASLHSINPAFRLASPSPALSRATLILGDTPDIGFFIPLP